MLCRGQLCFSSNYLFLFWLASTKVKITSCQRGLLTSFRPTSPVPVGAAEKSRTQSLVLAWLCLWSQTMLGLQLLCCRFSLCSTITYLGVGVGVISVSPWLGCLDLLGNNSAQVLLAFSHQARESRNKELKPERRIQFRLCCKRQLLTCSQSV